MIKRLNIALPQPDSINTPISNDPNNPPIRLPPKIKTGFIQLLHFTIFTIEEASGG